MYECEWEEMKEGNDEIVNFIKVHLPQSPSPFSDSSPQTKMSILRDIYDGYLYGLVRCDIKVPESLRSHFSEMPPIFKNIDVSSENIDPFMRDFADEHKLLGRPRRTLIGSFIGKNIFLATPLLRWYLEHGLVVDEIYEVVEYTPARCFQGFADIVSENRRRGDLDPTKAILAETFKLLGNSAYGKSLENLENRRDVAYSMGRDVGKLVNSRLFRTCTPLDHHDLFEVESAKSKVRWNLPLQMGFFVYQYAKLRMLQFHYDFVDKFVSRDDYQLCEMDTDSLYMALSDNSLEEVVKPHLLQRFYREYPQWFPARSCDAHHEEFVSACSLGEAWNPRPCCKERGTFDKRTPGLFKIEFVEDGMVALCSKTYFAFGEKNKISCKGLIKNLNDIEKQKYLNVLKYRRNGRGLNKGFRSCGNAVFTYEQERASLSFLYIKRRVDKVISYAPIHSLGKERAPQLLRSFNDVRLKDAILVSHVDKVISYSSISTIGKKVTPKLLRSSPNLGEC
ncbi:hypothetical protein PoB_002173200 [Plakobranchus ocellatus]|uniref:DNA-directed DNA polymerase n=1 Tax=Plakobranchus ocellatus TaxID=259542 RepID=A0AAV3ZL15_9GAST|nr:hypothetical protein PoB_002173200 [Plakobranchus ocellatus]